MNYGYARISTKTQNIERQIRNIIGKYPDTKIYQEAYTGTKVQGRKELDKLLKRVVPGDTIIFDSASRMSRNADEAMELYKTLFNNNITLIFLKEPHINTDIYKQALNKQISATVSTGNSATDTFVNSIITALNQYTVNLATEQVRLCFKQAEKEVMDLRQRTKEGMTTAALHGARIGNEKGATFETKKSRAAKEEIQRYCFTFGGALTDKETIKLTGLARNTYYKYKKELLAYEQ